MAWNCHNHYTMTVMATQSPSVYETVHEACDKNLQLLFHIPAVLTL